LNLKIGGITIGQMNKKLHETIESIDTKSILLTFLIIVALVFLVFKYSNFVEINENGYDTKGQGTIVYVEPITQMRQSRKGTGITTISYRVTYKYSVNGVNYEQTDDIKNIGRNQLIIDKLTKADSVIKIVFSSTNPKDSKIYLGD
jgi:hypothetical protein